MKTIFALITTLLLTLLATSHLPDDPCATPLEHILCRKGSEVEHHLKSKSGKTHVAMPFTDIEEEGRRE